MKSMRGLAPVSVAGNIAIAFALGVVCYAAASQLHEHGVEPDLPPLRLSTLPNFFGISMFGFAIHGIILPVHESMNKPSDAAGVLNKSIFIIMVIYESISVFGYLAWGDSVNSIVLYNLPRNTMWGR